MFQQEHPHAKTGLSKFCSLRPVYNILLKSSTPREVCLCQYHDNIKMLCVTLSKEISSSYSRSFVDNLVCDSNKEECIAGKCQKCPNWFETMKGTSLNLEEMAEWSQWKRVSQTEKGKNGKTKAVKKMVRVLKEGTLEEASEGWPWKVKYPSSWSMYSYRGNNRHILRSALLS